MKYLCTVCGYIYDEAKEAAPFSELPDSWKCPLCGAAKSDFAPQEEKAEKNRAKASDQTASLKKLSAGQLSALCSNLARGCEKQYKADEAGLFRELAEYFAAITPQDNDASVENLPNGCRQISKIIRLSRLSARKIRTEARFASVFGEKK